jgi:beta-lactamase superfamily II metal-dependent hydrolase
MSRISIDMLDVGKGDAYVVELYDDQGTKFVFVVDGGTAERSDILLSHVRNYHNNTINLAVSTHPDTDHIGGLISLFENANIGHLFLNDPRDFISQDTLMQRARTNLSRDEVEVFKSAFDRMDELKELAQAQSTTHHPATFADSQPRFSWGGWSVYILGPSENLFRDIWLNEDVVRDWFSSDTVDQLVSSQPQTSVLDDPSIDTKPVNNSSIIMLIEGYGKKYLFTGDAGKRAIRDAMAVRDIRSLTWLDVPHHGSRRNLDTEIINHLAPNTSYISSPGTTKHPRRTIVRALQKAGSRVYSTCKNSHMCHQVGLTRQGWNTAQPWTIIS